MLQQTVKSSKIQALKIIFKFVPSTQEACAHGHFTEIFQDRTDTVISACFEEIARAISAHVTDILVKRLGLDEACADIEEGKNYQKHYESIRMKRELPPERQVREK